MNHVQDLREKRGNILKLTLRK